MTLRPLDRWPFFWQSAVLLLLKYNLDRAVAWWGFGCHWFPWNYVSAPLLPPSALPLANQYLYLALLFLSLPFAAAGIWLVLRRLLSADLPRALCVFFFLPVVNLLFFLTLCVVSSRPEGVVAAKEGRRTLVGSWGDPVAAILLVGLLGLAFAEIGVKAIALYGMGLFVGLPFLMGMVSVLLYTARKPRSLRASLLVALLPLIVTGAGLLAMKSEGLICLIMAFPIGIVLALFGGFVGYTIARSRNAGIPPAAALLLFAALPLVMGMEKQADPQPPLLAVTSSVMVDAPPEKIWPAVVAFPPIPPGRDLLLRTGIAYPTRARIDGTGVGAVRHCIFSTGEFVEPVEVWDAPRLLRFSVAAQPEPMEELSPYGHIETPHLHGYMHSQEGEIRLVPLPGGQTRLEGTTWYTNRIWPASYWRLWSDLIIHRIHLRVLNHIKAVSEAGAAATKGA